MSSPSDFDATFGGDGGDRPARRLRHQPADPIDLVCYPARDAVCLGFRELLRDYCDGDLSVAATSAVEDHVHVCRDCALALARAESEQHTLQRALGAIREDADRDALASGAYGPSFTRRVMAEVSAILLEEEEAPPSFTKGVMERVRHEWRKVPLWRRASMRLRSSGFGVTLVAALLLIAAVLAIGSWQGDERALIPELQVVRATATAHVLGSESRPVLAGSVLPAGAVLRVDDRGEAILSQSLPNAIGAALPLGNPNGEPSRLEPGATLHLFGGATARVRPDATLELLAGAIRCATADRSHRLGFPDGSSVELDPAGDYEVSLTRVRRFDRAIAEFSLRLRLEVRSGRAEFRRADLESVRVEGGQIAHAEGVEVLLEDIPNSDRSAIAGLDPKASMARSEASASGVLLASGRVVDAASGRGVAAARVVIRSGSGRESAVVSDSDGWFRFEVDAEAKNFVTVGVTPPAIAEVDLGIFGPRPVELVRDGRGAPVLTVALSADLTARGRVVDAAGAPIVGARVSAWVVDEAFALVRSLDLPASNSSADGSFALRGLPADLDGQESVAILVEHAGHPRSAHPTWRGGDDLLLRVPSPRRVSLAGLPAGVTARVLQEIPGIPLLAMAEVFDLTTSSAGESTVESAGPGSLWLDEREQGGGLVALRARGDGSFLASTETRPQSLRGIHRKWVASVSDGRAALLRPQLQHRFELEGDARSIGAGVEGRERQIAVRSSGPAMGVGARVFLETASGELAFLGLWDGLSEIRYRAPAAGFRLVVLGVDGSIGVLETTDGETVAVAVDLVAPGSAVASAEFAAVRGACLFELLDGPIAGQRFWREVDFGVGIGAERLPPGNYRVTMPDGRLATCQIASAMRAQLIPVARVIEER